MSAREVLEVDITYKLLYDEADENERKDFKRKMYGTKHKMFRERLVMKYFQTHWSWHDLGKDFRASVHIQCRRSLTLTYQKGTPIQSFVKHREFGHFVQLMTRRS